MLFRSNGGDFYPNTRAWFIDPSRPMAEQRAYDIRRAVDFLASTGASEVRAMATGVPASGYSEPPTATRELPNYG